MEKQNKIAVIVGRFQTSTMHEGYHNLFKYAFENYDGVVIVLGTSPRKNPTKTDPLDFSFRKRLIKEQLVDVHNSEGKPYEFHENYDNRSDEIWSNNLDSIVKEAVGPNKAEFLISRDSFEKYYHGKTPFFELPETSVISSTEIRNQIGEIADRVLYYGEYEDVQNFSRGLIFATQQQYDRVDVTVDIALMAFNKENGFSVLLGRKKNDPEGKYRFPGGFVDVEDDNFGAAASRELFEETGIEINPYSMIYVKSAKIPDWRYRKGNDVIMTSLFEVCETYDVLEKAVASDDLEELKIFNVEDIQDVIVHEHYNLAETIFNRWK